ncbi:hypothetical protein D3C81_1967510 [compost metagenome]
MRSKFMRQFVTQCFQHVVGADESWLDDVDQDIHRTKLHRQPSSKRIHEGFG